MLDSIISHYKKNLSSYGLVFKYFKIKYNIFQVSACLFLLSIPILVTAIIFKYYIVRSLVIFTISLILMAFMILMLNSNSKLVIKDKYNIKPQGFLWRNEDYENMQDKLLMNYLEEKGILSENKIKLLISLLKSESDKRKLPRLIAPGIFFSMFVPTWIQLIGIIYKQYQTIQAAIVGTVGILTAIFVIIGILEVLKMVYNSTIDQIINKESYWIGYLIEKLETILLKLPEKVK